MSSLWTPDGEHRVARESAPPPADGPTGAGDPAEDEMRALAAELLAAPVADVIANHCYGLFELAALHLSQREPDLEAARVAIDAMGFLVDGLNERLGDHFGALAEGLAQLRLAWVRIAEAASPPPAD